jgi:hypothetical protein
LRIGIVGILVEWYGPQAAEGFLHLFEGWVLFLATLAMLVLEMWAFTNVQPLPGSRFLNRFGFLRIGFRIDPSSRRACHRPGVAGTGLCREPRADSPVALFSWSIGERQEVVPERSAFVDFGMRIGEWQGSPQPVEPQLISACGLMITCWPTMRRREGPSPSTWPTTGRSERANPPIPRKAAFPVEGGKSHPSEP